MHYGYVYTRDVYVHYGCVCTMDVVVLWICVHYGCGCTMDACALWGKAALDTWHLEVIWDYTFVGLKERGQQPDFLPTSIHNE